MNVFELMGRLILDKSEYDEGLDEAEKETTGFGDKLKKGLGTATAVAGSALAVGATATIGLTKQVVDAYGQYEQLAGGVETLFGEASEAVMENASKAFATAGLSVNEYMETVTSFSASLIQATGRGEQQDIDELEKRLDERYDITKRELEDEYDAVKASYKERIALTKDKTEKQALQAERDEALKELKRSNEDQLKALKAKNEEEIALAEQSNQTSVKSAESLQKASELADMAIIDMSDNANKMGTNMQSIQNAYAGFAKGNYTMLDNLKLGYGGTKEEMQRLLADAERLSGTKFDLSSYADIVEAIHVVQTEMGITGTTSKEASSTITGSMGAVKKAWENLVIGFADPDADIGKLVSDVIDNASVAFGNLVPVITRAMSGIGKGLPMVAEAILDELPNFINEILPTLIETAVELVRSVAEALPEIIKSLADMLPTIIPALVQGMIDIIMALVDNLDLLADALIQLMLGIVTGIINALPILIEKLPEILYKIAEAIITNIPILLQAVWQLLVTIGETLWTFLTDIYEKGKEWFSKMITSVGEWLSELPNKIAYWLGYAIGTVLRYFADLPKNIKEYWTQIIENAKQFFVNLNEKGKEGAQRFKENLINGIKELPEKIKEIGRNIVDGLKNGIKEKWDNMVEWFHNLGQGLIDGFKNTFKVSSPSKVMAEIGGFVAEGFGVGFDKEFEEVKKDIENVSLDMNVQAKANGGTIGGAVIETENKDAEIADLLRAILRRMPDGVDPNSIFKLVREQNEEFRESTGASAFA